MVVPVSKIKIINPIEFGNLSKNVRYKIFFIRLKNLKLWEMISPEKEILKCILVIKVIEPKF
ncbi:hypothetical protein LEP1GSC059_0507 [Leptospira noguchii serovar Panama str. CZ214]|uniref:Uncharacterized protein n=1 Tax=Leptospira noguchii serovar Panama str. CZ214 TaxID=1001595 RepID=T0FJG5_9LEPT|nr:hypothetical protein LEP1GSC059_0507 [Leptospira noguchii serovar Panama str. CZ214]